MSKGNQDQSSESMPDFVTEQPGTTARFVENRPTSTSQVSEELRNFPNLVSLLLSPSKRNIETSLQESGQHSSSEITSPSKKQATFIQPSQRTRTFSVPAQISFPSRKETGASEKQRIRTHSYSAGATSANPRKQIGKITSHTEALSTSKQQITVVSPRQKKGTISSPIETSASKEQVTAECSRKQTGSRPTPAEPTSEVNEYIENKYYSDTVALMSSTDSSDTENEFQETSKKTSLIEQEREVISTTMNIENNYPELVDLTSSTEEITDSCDTQNETSETSEMRPLISQQQSSASTDESPLKNPSQHSKIFQDTKIEKDERLEKRPGLFGQFKCGNCLVEFTTQDELLRHELIHFND